MVRLRGDAASVLPLLRAEVRRIDPGLPIEPLRLLSSDVERQIGTQRRLTGLIAAFGALALLLAGVGLYGIVASAVAARRREIGVRIALGAGAPDVTRLFVYRGLRVTGAGRLVGGGLAIAVGRLVSTVVWGVDPLDLRTLVLAALLLTGTALLASWAPSRRAARLDPTITLRQE
jgi:putative ABC transport system permease protein